MAAARAHPQVLVAAQLGTPEYFLPQRSLPSGSLPSQLPTDWKTKARCLPWRPGLKGWALGRLGGCSVDFFPSAENVTANSCWKWLLFSLEHKALFLSRDCFSSGHV